MSWVETIARHQDLTYVMEGELHRLVEEYWNAVSEYSEAVRRLTSLEGSDFNRAYRETEVLHDASERCRTALEKYTKGSSQAAGDSSLPAPNSTA